MPASSSQLDLFSVRPAEDDPAPAVFTGFTGGRVVRRAQQFDAVSLQLLDRFVHALQREQHVGQRHAQACRSQLRPGWGSLLAIGPDASPARRPERFAPDAPLPSVVMISLDTLGAEYLSSFGGPEGVSPHLDRLLAGEPVHLLNTDPPYNVRVEPRSNNAIAAGLSSFGQTHHQKLDLARHPEKAKATHKQMRAKDRPLENDFVSDEEFDRLLDAWFGNIARGAGPSGFSLDAILIAPVMPSSRSSSSTGLPG